MLFKDAFKPREYQKIFALGYYTPVAGMTTISYRIGKQSPSQMKIPTSVFDTLKVDDTTKAIINLPECLSVIKDDETGFKKLVYVPANRNAEDDSED